jgi:uncharacterized protein
MRLIGLTLLPLFVLILLPSDGIAQTASPAPRHAAPNQSLPMIPAPPHTVPPHPMIPIPIRPWPPMMSGARVIEVSGNGEIQAAPDLATLEVAIETHATTADRAAGLNGALAEKVRDAIKAKLGDKGTMWTGGYSLSPEYTEPREGKPTVTGYSAENSITVQTGELGLIGPLIDAAIGAGANRINSLNYSLRADSKARAEAITKATRDAQIQAAALADALGVKLGPVIKASTESEVHVVPMARFQASALMAGAAQTPIAAGQVTVPATVSLTFGIE